MAFTGFAPVLTGIEAATAGWGGHIIMMTALNVRNRKMKKLTIAVAAALSLTSGAMAEQANHAEEAKGLIKQFAGQLKGELVAAMKAGGPVNAISVCKDKAPAIAASLSEQSGWHVARTSLKTRNPANAPDDYERAVMEQFEADKASGKDPMTLAKGEVTEVDGAKTFRFMKAIPTGEVCLACHGGDSVKPEVEAKLAELYPEDTARGFSAGDLRGAFTLSKRVD
jgi:hypothetical protein